MSGTEAAAIAPARTFAGAALVLLSTVCLSLAPTAAKLAYIDGSNTLTVLALRGLGAVLLMLLLIGAFERRWTYDRRDLAAAIIAGLWYCLMLFGYFGSVNYIDVKLAILIYFLHPILIVAASALMNRQSMPAGQIALSILIFSGLAVVLGAEFSQLDWRGLGLALLSAIGITGVIIFNAKAQRTMSTLSVNLVMTTVTTVVFGVLAAAMSDWAWPRSSIGWSAILMAALALVVGLLAFFKAFQFIGVVRATVLSNVEPLFGILIAYALLGERLTGYQLIGAAIIILGLFGFELVGRRQLGKERIG
jgi:drug/metabolite transporter (DMT)-like permease